MKASELKRCPFCGGEAELFSDFGVVAEDGKQAGKRYFVWCNECSALVSGDTAQEACDEWNRRVE